MEAEEGTLLALPAEVVGHIISFVSTPWDLCTLSMVCRTLAEMSRSESVWRAMGHPSWHVDATRAGGGWKQAYLQWLREALQQYLYYRSLETPPSSSKKKEKKRKEIPLNEVKEYDHFVSITFAGSPDSGKTALITRYLHDSFTETYAHTNSSDFFHRVVEHQGMRFKMSLAERLSGWHQGGIHSFYRGVHVCFLLYDVTTKEQVDTLQAWKAELDRHLSHITSVVLVGTKCDGPGRDEDGGVMAYCIEAGRKLAREWGFDFFTCSAKTGEGVQETILSSCDMFLTRWRNVRDMIRPAYLPSAADMETLIAMAKQAGRDLVKERENEKRARIKISKGKDKDRCAMQ